MLKLDCVSCGNALESAIVNIQNAKRAYITAAPKNAITILKPN